MKKFHHILLALALLLAPSTFAALPIGTVAYYSFENSLTDGSSSNNDLEVTLGGPVSYGGGRFNNALYLDGSTVLGTLSGKFPRGVPTGAAPYTVAAWIKADTGCSLTGGWIGYGNNTNSQGNNFRLNGTGSVWEYWYFNDFGAPLSSGTFFDGFHSVVGTWDGTNEILYLDGVATQRNPKPTGLKVGTNLFYVGRTLNDVRFKGWIDDLLIVNRALTPWEIAAYQSNEATTLRPVVTTATDSGLGSLRQVLLQAPSRATVTFDPSLSGQTITLTSGEIMLTQDVTIDGSALPGGIQINGNANSRIFYVSNTVTAALVSLTITNGYATGFDPIHPGFGGGVFNDGVLLMTNCTVVGNTCDEECGGMQNNSTASLTQCTISGNTSPDEGAGVRNEGSLTLLQCTISRNSSDFGAGLHNLVGGSLFPATVTLINSIVSDNDDSDIDNQENITFAGTNIVQSFGGNPGAGTTPLNVSANLAPLGKYGGPTMTMPPLPGSPVINAGSDADASNLATDQRGLLRKIGTHVDLGAVELQTPFLVVTDARDSVPGSLRRLVGQADTGSLITFATNLSGKIITLTNGQIVLSNNVTIDGSALANGIQLNGKNSSRIFQVLPDAIVMLNSLTITNGNSGVNSGGGIYNQGHLTLSQCAVVSNVTTGSGGGVNNRGDLIVNSCTFANNSSESFFGAGGGIENVGTLIVNQSTFSGNSANGGGAIFTEAGSELTVRQSTVCSNTAFCCGGGITVYGSSGIRALLSSIVAGNTGGNLYYGVGTGFTVTVSNLTGINPLLAPLGNYGGPTQTMPPLPGSPAIDAGRDFLTNQFATDQRGLPRKIGAHVDIGAVEADPQMLLVLISGGGNIVTNYNGKFLPIGSTNTMTATPLQGFAFKNWSGGTSLPFTLVTNGTKIKFVMQSNLVLVATFADRSKSVLTVTAPARGQFWSNNAFTATGKVSHNWPLDSVWYQLNSNGWQRALGTIQWSASLSLNSRSNLFQAFALDTLGNYSATSSVSFTYIVSDLLTVRTNPIFAGTITPSYNGHSLENGKTYTMTAKANTGFTFTNWTWTGGGFTNAATVRFVMASNLVFTANFRDSARPVCIVLSPAANQNVTNPAPVASGKASDNVGVAAVMFSLDGGDWSNAALGTGGTNWMTRILAPQNGPNTIAAAAVDAAGNYSLTNTVKFNYLVLPVADWAPDSLNGLLVKVTVDGGDTESVGFDPLLFAQTGTDTNADNYGLGSYTYLKLSTNTAQLNLQFTEPPTDTNSSFVWLVFTNHYHGYFTNTATTDNGGFDARIATNIFRAALQGHTFTAVDSDSGKTNVVTFPTTVSFVKTPANNSNTGSSKGTYTWARYSPVGGLLTLTFTNTADLGETAYVQVTFTNTTSGVYYRSVINGAVLQDAGNGVFKLP